MTDDVWEQDLRVLRGVIECHDAQEYVLEITAEHLADRHLDAMSATEVKASLKRLRRGSYVTDPSHPLASWAPGDSIHDYTDAALRAVGAWPSPEQALGRLVDALTAAADDAHDDETAGALRKTARYLGSGVSQIGYGVAAAVIHGQTF